MCDWIIEKMPWLVEHVGSMPLVWQIVLALGIVAALTLGYCFLQNALSYECTSCRSKPAKHSTRRERVNYFSDSDRCDSTYDWVDPEKLEVWQ